MSGSANERFPFRYFVVTFLWTWIFWLPLALAGLGILPSGEILIKDLLAPATFIGESDPRSVPFIRSEHSLAKAALPIT